MTLRTRLLASYLLFVVTLVVLAAWSVWGLEQAGAVSRRILSENYESVIATQDMKEALERQHSAALFARLGDSARAPARLPNIDGASMRPSREQLEM